MIISGNLKHCGKKEYKNFEKKILHKIVLNIILNSKTSTYIKRVGVPINVFGKGFIVSISKNKGAEKNAQRANIN